MAGDWIKVECSTPDKPEVVLMSSILKLNQDAVFGKLLRVWMWADGHSVSGTALTVTEAFIDVIARCKGFAKAMRQAGWLDGENGNLRFPNFTRHNGKSAKKRVVDMERKRQERDCPEFVPDSSEQNPANGRTERGQNSDRTRTKLGQNADKTRTRERGTSTTPVVPLPGDDPLAKVRRLWRKKDSTELDDSEERAWRKGRKVVAQTTEEEWALLHWWHEADPAEIPEARWRRQDFATQVNHWRTEIERAGVAAHNHGVNFGKKENRRPEVPPDWQGICTDLNPEYNQPKSFFECGETVQRAIWREWRRRQEEAKK